MILPSMPPLGEAVSKPRASGDDPAVERTQDASSS